MTTTTTTFDPVIGAEAAAAAEQVAGAYALSLAAKYAAGAVSRDGMAITTESSSRSTVTPTPAATRSTSGINWDCVASAETGGNWSMHGSNYSTALGIMNQAIRENTDPSTAARIIAGEGTRAEQVQVAESIVRKHGFRHSWGELTVEKCA